MRMTVFRLILRQRYHYKIRLYVQPGYTIPLAA